MAALTGNRVELQLRGQLAHTLATAAMVTGLGPLPVRGHILPLWGLQGQGSGDASPCSLSQRSSGGPHGSLAKHRLVEL